VNWLEVSVTTDPEAAEAVVELFNRYGQGGAVVEMQVDCFEHELAAAGPPPTVVVKTYLPILEAPTRGAPTIQNPKSKIQNLQEGLWHLSQIYPIPEPVIRELAEEDWANAWKQQYHILRIGRRIVIVPDWEEYATQPGDVVLRLEPGMAFGTGLHPTTRLCLRALEACFTDSGSLPESAIGNPESRIQNALDVGTGSGILAVAAAKLGAHEVLALDADPVAVAVARENVARNGVSAQVTTQYGSLPGSSIRPWLPGGTGDDTPLPLLKSGQFDLVLINILAPVIVALAPALAARTAAGGILIAAGLVDSQEADVTHALETEGFQMVARFLEKDWVCLVSQRSREATPLPKP
jgi:ribosomal protein L11 methyltransferase